MNEEYKPTNKENLRAVVDKLKTVLNPTITAEIWPEYNPTVIELATDITEAEYPISFYIKCLDDENKIIYTQGYIVDNTGEGTVINNGSSKITQIAFTFINNTARIALIPESGTILKTEAEAFICSDNKNHITSINYVEATGEYDFQDIPLDIDENFHYVIDTGSELIDIENGVNRVTPIDTINHSVDATELTHPLYVKIKGVDINNEYSVIFESLGYTPILTGENDGVTTITAKVLTDDIVNTVLGELEIPVAASNTIGGVALTDSSNLLDDLYPIELDENNGAYVDLSDYEPDIETDIHRFVIMPVNPSEAGNNTLIQYIGNNTDNYTCGYYYKWAPTNFEFTVASEGWYETSHNTVIEKLVRFNVEHDYILADYTQGPIIIVLKDLLEEGDAITSSTVFRIYQGTWFDEDITYGELNDLGLILKDNPDYLHYSENLNYDIAIINLLFLLPTWRLKNVQPMIKVGSPLVFKGTITASSGETDIEALERQVPVPDNGDFYIVLPSHQEYYWTGTDWEFMGDIFDPYEAGDGIAITSTHEISVKYDNSTIKKNSSGNLYVDGVLTDTQADWTESNSSSPAYIKHKPTIPAVNDSVVTFATSGNISDKFTKFGLNQVEDAEVTIAEGSNIKLTPDLANNKLTIEAINDNTTYSFSLSGNTLTITPSSGSATSYTPTINPGTVTSITAGRGLLGGTITNNGTIDIDTQVNIPPVSNNSITINYNSNKYIRACVGAGNTLNINVQLTSGQSGTKYAKEIIVRIDDTSTGETSPARIKVNQDGSGTLKNMYNSVITGSTGLNIYSGDVLELVFTFWDNNDVTFNGGVNV